MADGIPLLAPELADTISGFDPAGFSALAAVEDTNFWFVPRNRLIAGLIAKYFPQARRFLEIGCGNGYVLAGVAGLREWEILVGSELHPIALRTARARLGRRAQFVQMDARKILARDAFDLIGAFDVLEHIEEDEMVLAAMHQALCPGGGVLIAVPQHPFLWSQVDENAHHVRRYRRGEMERKLESAGFEILFSASYTALLLPLMAASRFRKRRSAPDGSQVISEIDVSTTLNGALKWLLQREVSATLSGFRFPAGGSRVVAARRARA